MKHITNGSLLIVIGVLHELLGLAAGSGLVALSSARPRNLFAEIARDGVIGAVELDDARSVLFWYFFCGLSWLILGWLLHQLERRGDPIPRAVGWQLGALGLAGGLLIGGRRARSRKRPSRYRSHRP